MDVLNIQRMNALASELRKHNFASSSDDAFQQAQRVYQESDVQQVVVEEKPVVVPKANPLEEKKVELLLEMNNRKYDNELGLLRSAVNSLAQEIEGLKAELRKLSEVAPPRPKERQEPLKTEPKELHPRQGNFQPSDVDIQKMFYFGTKH